MRTAVATNSRSPQTIGLEWLRPGIGVFHRMFFAGPTAASPFQVSGSVAVATPEASAPRNDGQFAVGASCVSRARTRRRSMGVIIRGRPFVCNDLPPVPGQSCYTWVNHEGKTDPVGDCRLRDRLRMFPQGGEKRVRPRCACTP